MRLTRRDALIIIDVLNPLDFPGAEKIHPWAKRMTPRLLSVRSRARRSGLPVIHVNDNLNDFHNSFEDVVRKTCQSRSPGGRISRRLQPGRGDFRMLKPRHSAFFSTPLDLLLKSMDVRRVILSGIATNLCVLFTAHDAHMLGYKIIVISDCCAAETDAFRARQILPT